MSQNARAVIGLVTGGLIMVGILFTLRGCGSLMDPYGYADAVPRQQPVPFEDASWELGIGAASLLLGAVLAVWLARRS